MADLPDYRSALDALLAGAPTRAERPIALRAALGAILAEDIPADRDQPPFDRAAMDGYAIRAEDVAPGCSLRVVGAVAAGEPSEGAVGPGEAIKIATGAPLPRGADAVIRHEATDRGEPLVRITAEVRAGEAVHPRGADCRAAEIVLPRGIRLGPHHLGVAAAVGRETVLVQGGRPAVFVLTTGDEVVDDATSRSDLVPHQIRNSNGPMIESAVPYFGAAVAGRAHCRDVPDASRRLVSKALEQADILVTIGGVSAGERDFITETVIAAGFKPVLRGAAIQPGRPIFAARRDDGALAIGLPGNPVSALVTAHLFIWPVARIMAGLSPDLPWREVELAAEVRPNSRRQAFRPAILDAAGRATVPGWAGSGDLIHTVPTHGLVELPMQEQALGAGHRARFLPWAWIAKSERPQ